MKRHFLTGVICLIPVVIIFLGIDLILDLGEWVTSFFPVLKSIAPEIVLHFFGVLISCGLVVFLGFLINQKIGKKLTDLFSPIILKVPLLRYLFKITRQISTALKNTNSFKKVLLVRFPTETTWSVAFLTGEEPEVFKASIKANRLVSVFIPTTPNPTNGYLVLMDSKNCVETDIPVATAISFIISMGTAGATERIMEKSHSNLEGDFFYLTTIILFRMFGFIKSKNSHKNWI